MDAVDILGSLLGKKSGGGGLGGQILKSILAGKKKPAAAPAPAPAPRTQPRQAPRHIPGGADGGLDDLLRGAYRKYAEKSGQPMPAEAPDPSPAPSQQSQLDNDQAEVLVRAMVNAAKADGQISQDEQNAIVGQLGELSQDDVKFLRTEFAAPLDVREFVYSVPLGMEEKVYAVSLMAIDLDANPEAKYLHELAHGFRMPPESVNRIHDRFGAPKIYT